MKEEIKHAAEAVVNNPKTSVVITSAITSNAWLDYGQPIIQGLTSIVGLIVIILIAVKYALDIKKELTKKD